MPASTSAARRLRLGVGIDTARYGHHVTFLGDDLQRVAPDLPVPESRVGYHCLERQLRRLREKHPDAELHVRIDAAGQYAANLERFLRSLDLSLQVSVGEPKRNKDYHHAHSPKRQDDQTESWAMARYALLERPAPSRETPPEFAVLRRIASRLEAQVRQTTRLTNQLHELLSAVFPELANLARDITVQWVLKLLERYPTAPRIAAARLDSLQGIPRLSPEKAQQLQTAARNSVGTLRGETCEALVRQLVRELRASLDDETRWKKLLTQAFDALPPGPHRRIATITGIGKVTAAAIVATAVSIERFQTPEKFVGFYGVFPRIVSSGVDKFGRSNPPGKKSMCAKGNDLVRGLLWNCAKSAALFNPAVRTLYQRLTSLASGAGRTRVRPPHAVYEQPQATGIGGPQLPRHVQRLSASNDERQFEQRSPLGLGCRHAAIRRAVRSVPAAQSRRWPTDSHRLDPHRRRDPAADAVSDAPLSVRQHRHPHEPVPPQRRCQQQRERLVFEEQLRL